MGSWTTFNIQGPYSHVRTGAITGLDVCLTQFKPVFHFVGQQEKVMKSSPKVVDDGVILKKLKEQRGLLGHFGLLKRLQNLVITFKGKSILRKHPAQSLKQVHYQSCIPFIGLKLFPKQK